VAAIILKKTILTAKGAKNTKENTQIDSVTFSPIQ